jgi:hypothetical protein
MRILKDDLHLAAHVAHRRPGQRRQLTPLEADAAAGRLDEPDEAASERGLAAAGLPDQTERLAVLHVETYAVDRLDVLARTPEQPGPHREVFLEIANLEQRQLTQP